MAVNTTYSNPASAIGSGGLDIATGDQISETTWDRAASDIYHLGGSVGYIGCAAFHNANQSIATATQTDVALNAELFDSSPDGAMHDTVTNNERVTIKTAGVYHIEWSGAFASNATGIRVAYLVHSSGSTIDKDVQTAVNGEETLLHLQAIRNFNANDWVKVQVYQNSGGALNLVTQAYSPLLHVLKA